MSLLPVALWTLAAAAPTVAPAGKPADACVTTRCHRSVGICASDRWGVRGSNGFARWR